jgi:hypothetical protein
VRAPETGTWTPPELISDARGRPGRAVLARRTPGGKRRRDVWDGRGGGGIQASICGRRGTGRVAPADSKFRRISPHRGGSRSDASSTAVSAVLVACLRRPPVSAPVLCHVETSGPHRLAGRPRPADGALDQASPSVPGTRAPFSVRAVPWGLNGCGAFRSRALRRTAAFRDRPPRHATRTRAPGNSRYSVSATAVKGRHDGYGRVGFGVVSTARPELEALRR